MIKNINFKKELNLELNNEEINYLMNKFGFQMYFSSILDNISIYNRRHPQRTFGINKGDLTHLRVIKKLRCSYTEKDMFHVVNGIVEYNENIISAARLYDMLE